MGNFHRGEGRDPRRQVTDMRFAIAEWGGETGLWIREASAYRGLRHWCDLAVGKVKWVEGSSGEDFWNRYVSCA
jgi:hypothetical protein